MLSGMPRLRAYSRSPSDGCQSTLSRVPFDTAGFFRGGDFAAGIKAGVAAMIERLGGSYDPALAPVQVREPERAPSPIPLAIALPIIMIIVLNLLFSQRRRGRFSHYGPPIILPYDWGARHGGFGGGGRSGGFSGGGGSFGGGGASGRW